MKVEIMTEEEIRESLRKEADKHPTYGPLLCINQVVAWMHRNAIAIKVVRNKKDKE